MPRAERSQTLAAFSLQRGPHQNGTHAAARLMNLLNLEHDKDFECCSVNNMEKNIVIRYRQMLFLDQALSVTSNFMSAYF